MMSSSSSSSYFFKKFPIVLLLLSLLISINHSNEAEAASSSSSSSTNFAAVDGKVLELEESNFDSAISSFDYILVDFYAPWCGHCKRLNPELDAAAPILAGLKEPIVIAKINADKFTRLARKYDIDGYPTLKLFMHGIPVEYTGPRKAGLLVQFLKKFVAPDVSILDSDSSISSFIESAGADFPIYIGFGLNESIISRLAIKHKKKAWFSVAKDFSEEVMILYDFDKVPALVSLHRTYNERNIFYGPFEEEFLEDFIKQNLLPPAMPINYDTLKLLRDDDRKIVLAIVEDETDEKSLKLIKLLKAAASANRDLVFGYVGVRQWEDFADTFGVSKKTQLPKMIVWDGNEEYVSVIGSESIYEEDQGSQISRFLEGYREGSITHERIGGPSFFGYLNSLMGTRTVYSIVFVIIVIMLIRSIHKEEPLTVGTRAQVDDGSSSASAADGREIHGSGDKED